MTAILVTVAVGVAVEIEIVVEDEVNVDCWMMMMAVKDDVKAFVNDNYHYY